MNDLYRRWFTAKEIKEHLGITAGQLFHWSRTWNLFTPDIKAAGRQGKDKYSLKSLMSLFFIQQLLFYGIDLKSIKEILESLVSSLQKEGLRLRSKNINSIWDYHEHHKQEISEKGLVVAIDQAKYKNAFLNRPPNTTQKKKKKYSVILMDGETAVEQLSEDIMSPGFAGGRLYFGILIINLKAIVQYMEHLMSNKK